MTEGQMEANRVSDAFAAADYQALVDGAAILLRPTAGVIILTDSDRSDFLHRMTTNEINKLKAGQSAVTVLTNPTARIEQVFTVVARPDELWLLPAPDQTVALERHLRGQIFFMDKVKVRNGSETYKRLRVMGPQATTVLTQCELTVSSLANGAWLEHDGILVLKQEHYDLPGYEVIVQTTPQDDLLEQSLIKRLQAAGATLLTDERAYQSRRIELGLPLPGYELINEYNPLEAELGWSCAENKGCYTGQEIIARQITYDKVTKRLVGLRSEALLTPGAELFAAGRNVGTVTSVAYSPTLGAPIALAIIKRPHNEVNTALQVADQPVTVTALPFV